MNDRKKTKAQLIVELEELREQNTERKIAVEELQQSELKNLKYVAGSIQGFLIYKDGYFVFANSAFAELVGYSVEELLNMTQSEMSLLVHPNDRQAIIQRARDRLSGKKLSLSSEFRFIRKDGSVRYVEAFSTAIEYDGQPAVQAFVTDITERKKAEEALKEKIIELNSFINNIPDMAWLMDIESRYIATNKAYGKAVGKNPNDLINKGYEFCYGKKGSKKLREDDMKVIKSLERTIIVEKINIGKNIIWSETIKSPMFDNSGKVIGIVGISRNITERKKAEAGLKESEARYHELYENAPDMFATVYADTDKIVQCNRTLLEALGYTQGEILFCNISEIYHPNCEKKREKVYQTLVKTGEVINAELQLKRKDGSKIDVILNVSSLCDEHGNIQLNNSVWRDITDRKQLEEEQAKASKLESIGLLAGGIAHDFNNILTVILGNTLLAKMQLDKNDKAEELLTEVEKASVRATKLTQQLLTFAKGGAPVKEITELTELIRETTKFSLRGSNVQYRASIVPNLWTAEVDKGQISQVIGNLVINAKHSMPEGGTINIKAKNVTVTPEDNLPLKNGSYVKISLEDKGHGIPTKQLTKIFDPYFTTKQMGNGLGLATVYSIIHRHEGHIAVESEVGVGTTFDIYLPASSKQIEEKETGKENSAVLTGKILVMDDEEIVRNFVLKALKSFGNDVDEASNGAEAIEKYKKAMDSGKPFDVVILDLTIPGGMGGQVAIKKLLEIDPDAKAVVSSGYANDPVISNFEDYGFSGYIPKPYKLDELKKVLNEVLTEKN